MAYEYQPWPSWAFGPNGQSAIFQSEDEVPAGWEHHGKVKGRKSAKAPVAAEGKEEIAGLREHYKKVTGKRPFPGWGADELRARMDAAEAGSKAKAV